MGDGVTISHLFAPNTPIIQENMTATQCIVTALDSATKPTLIGVENDEAALFSMNESVHALSVR